MSVDVVRCYYCNREQAAVAHGGYTVNVLEPEDAAADAEIRAFLESFGWRFDESRYVAHDWSGVAGAARWVCPICTPKVPAAVPS